MSANSISSTKRSKSGLRDRLREILEHDFDNNQIVPSTRSGKIHRRRYAERLDCDPTRLSACSDIFAEFERKCGVITGPMVHLPDMRAWLRKSFDARELGIRDGKIDRSAFAAQFGLRGGAFMVRYPEIRDLLQEYDARVQDEGYLPAAQSEELERLRVALAGEPELNKDRITINAVTLSAAANVPQGRFRDRPFAELIAEAQAKIDTRVMASKIDPYFHNRVFWFSGLTLAWGDNFVERIAIRFKQVISGMATASSKRIYLGLINALDWIGSSEITCCQIVKAEAQDTGRISNAGEWEDALFAYREHLVSQIAEERATDSNVDGNISTLRTALDALVSGRIIPQIANHLFGIKHVRRRAGHLQSVAEAPAKNRGSVDYVAFAREHFETARKSLEIDIGAGDSEPFFASIGQELQTFPGLPADPSAAVKIVLERRLETLRTKAFAIVEEAALAYKRGRALIAASDIDCENFEASYFGASLNKFQKDTLLREVFPRIIVSDDRTERGLANFLAFIERQCGSIPPISRTDPHYGQFFAKRYLEYGGQKSIEPMLIPDSDVVGAVLTLYLVESGANVAVGRTLNRECSEKSDVEGYRRITGFKARAKGKPIIVDLPEDSFSVRAINWLLSAGKRLPEYVKGVGTPTSDEDRLFLMRIGDRVQLMTPHWYTSWFKEFATTIPQLATLNLTPNMIRPSVLLHASLSNDGRLMTGMAWAQHTQNVSQGYQQKWPTRLRYDQLMRQFLVSFESLVMKNVPEAAAKLGINPEQFEARLGNLQATGLGTFCRDARGRSGIENAHCSTIDCWNDCPNMLIVAEVEAIAALQLWQTALRKAQPEMERDQPERWDRVWLPWLCLTDVVEEKMVRGMIKIWNSATKRAQEISIQPGYMPAKPW